MRNKNETLIIPTFSEWIKNVAIYNIENTHVNYIKKTKNKKIKIIYVSDLEVFYILIIEQNTAGGKYKSRRYLTIIKKGII